MKATRLTVLDIGLPTKCTAPNCVFAASSILRYVEQSGLPLSNIARCRRHTREAIELVEKSGLVIEDQRRKRRPY